MKGEAFKRCGCKDADRKNLNGRCPRLSERSHGAWFYRFSEPAGPDGRRRQPLIGPFTTKTSAENDRIERMDRLNKGVSDLADRSLTVASDFDRWLEGKSKLKAGTRKEYQQIGKLYVRAGLGHLQVIAVRPQHIEDLYAAIRRIGLAAPEREPRSATLLRLLAARGTRATSRRRISAARVRRVHAVVHAYFATRTRQGMISRNPAAHLELASGRAPRALVWTDERVERWLRTGRRPSPVMVWTPEQTGLFLDFAIHDPLYAMWHLIAFRGLRRGEVCAVDRSELNLRLATLTIRVSRDADDLDTDDPGSTKSGHARIVALDIGTLEVLATYRQRQRQLQEHWGELYQDSGYLFTADDGRPLNLDTVSQHFERLVTRYESIRTAAHRKGATPPTTEALAGTYRVSPQVVELVRSSPPLPPIRLHDLRHVAACLAYRATKDLKLVSELMGHAGIQITADIYTSLFEDVDRDAVEVIAASVPRRPQPPTTPAPPTPDVSPLEPERGSASLKHRPPHH